MIRTPLTLYYLFDTGESVVCNYRPATDAERARCAAIEAVLARYDVPLGAASLQFPLGHPIVSSGEQTKHAHDDQIAYIILNTRMLLRIRAKPGKGPRLLAGRWSTLFRQAITWRQASTYLTVGSR